MQLPAPFSLDLIHPRDKPAGGSDPGSRPPRPPAGVNQVIPRGRQIPANNKKIPGGFPPGIAFALGED